MQRLPFSLLSLLIFATSLARADAIVVLPFFNDSNAQNVDWIGESIAESIRESLASQQVLVLSREDRLEAYKRLSLRPNAVLTHASIIKIGEALDASQVIYGHFEVQSKTNPDAAAPSGPAAGVSPHDSLRLSARILDLKHTRQGPELETTGALEDLASLETQLAWRCLEQVAPKVAVSEAQFRRDRPPVRLDAVESYIRGLLATSPEQKHRLFTQAVRLDADFSEPCFELGRMAWEKKDYTVASGWLQKVRRADSHYFEARFLLGLCRYYTADFSGAAESLELVSAAVPLNEVFNDLGAAQSRLGSPSAIDNFRHALEGDNSDPDYYFNLAYALWKRGDFSGAAENFRAVLDRAPEDAEAVSLLGRCLKHEGPRAGDPKTEARERLKLNFEETAYRQLKAELETKH